MSKHSGFTALGDIDMDSNDLTNVGSVSAGSVTSTGALDFGTNLTKSGGKWYGDREFGAYELSSTAATSVPGSGAYAQIAGTMIQSVATSEFSVSSGQVTYTGSASRIKITVHASIQATNNAFTVTMSVHKNSTIQSPVSKQYIHTAGVDHAVALTTIYQATSGDVFDIRIKNDSGVTQSVTVSALGFTLEAVA